MDRGAGQGSAYLDVSVVQPFGELVILHPHGEGVLVVAEGAEGVELEGVPPLGDHFGLGQGHGDFPRHKINI